MTARVKIKKIKSLFQFKTNKMNQVLDLLKLFFINEAGMNYILSLYCNKKDCIKSNHLQIIFDFIIILLRSKNIK